MNWIRRMSFSALMMSLLVVFSTGSALGADLQTVVDDVSTSGIYLDNGVSISQSDATEIVTTARNNGSRFSLVVLDDTPLGGNTAFAEAIYDELQIDAGTILVLSPDDVGWVSENEGFTAADVENALDFADANGGNDAQYAANFVVGLFGENVAATPAPTVAPAPVTTEGAAAAATGSSGGGSGFLWFILIVGGLGLLVFWMIRKSGKQTVNAAAEQMAKARMAVQKQVDAVANDILDMEDEVRVADNDEVDRFYNEASETYRTVTDQLPKAETPQQLVDISNDLDVAIWQLDSAEAILDGKPQPTRPEPKRLEPVPGTSRDRVTAPASRPDYERRPSRRSSYLGPGMLELLIGVAGQVLGGAGRGPRSGGLGSLLRRSSPIPTNRADGPTASGGGGVVPGPGSPVQRGTSTRSTTPSSGSTRRRSGGGRIRGGRRRGK